MLQVIVAEIMTMRLCSLQGMTLGAHKMLFAVMFSCHFGLVTPKPWVLRLVQCAADTSLQSISNVVRKITSVQSTQAFTR